MRYLAAALCFALVPAAHAANMNKTIKDGPLDNAVIYTATIDRDVPFRVRPFPTENADVGKTGKKKNQHVAKMMKEVSPEALVNRFIEQLRKEGFTDVEMLEEGTEAPENALVLEGEFTVLNPGSQAKRYWAGFGAGKSKVCTKGHVVAGDDVLMEYDHCRIGAMGLFGGDSAKQMTTDSMESGSHLAKFLGFWANGKYE